MKMPFRKFKFNSLQEILQEAASLGLELNFSENTGVFRRKVKIGEFEIPNSLAVNPMEGCDSNPDGSPSELTIRRYERFAAGGAGLLWLEAVAVTPEGRANPRQLRITGDNLDEFGKLHEKMRNISHTAYGGGFHPVVIMQLTHSGRYSKPTGTPAPIPACRNPYLDAARKLDGNPPVIKDGELERLEDEYVKAAVLAKKAGFSGVDVKCCHRYLNSELLSAFTREGKYGGTFEGRTRFLLNVVGKIRDRLGKDFIVTTRLNIYDAIPYPYGWGTDRENFRKYDLTEPIRLVEILYEKGVRLVNLTMGNPYYNPHVNRPYDKGPYIPDENPFEGVNRMIKGTGEVQKAVPDMAVVGGGYSWLRQFAPYAGAGSLEKGWAKLIGFGREAFAYPDFARDILEKGAMTKDKCCIACGKCTEIMRAGGTPGCVVRDSGVYAPIYNEAKKCIPPR